MSNAEFVSTLETMRGFALDYCGAAWVGGQHTPDTAELVEELSTCLSELSDEERNVVMGVFARAERDDIEWFGVAVDNEFRALIEMEKVA